VQQEIPGKAAIDAALKRIVTADRPGIALKHYTSLFTLLDVAGTWNTPSCLIMPTMLATIQREYVLKSLEEMDRPVRTYVHDRLDALSGKWKEFMEGCGAVYTLGTIEIFDEWQLSGNLCPLYHVHDDARQNACLIKWRRSTGCLATNPLFIQISRKLDERLYGSSDEEGICISLIEILLQHFGGQSASRRLILPKR
jgi:hypothetical protein